MDLSALIDEVYEAGILPEKWPQVLDRLAEIADAEGTLLFAAAPGAPCWVSSPAIHDRIVAWVNSPYFAKNPRGERLVPVKEPRFLTDLDAFTAEELEREDYYTKFLRPAGLGWCVGTSIRSPAGDALVFSVEKSHSKGPVPKIVVEQLDLIRPHLARASLLSGRIGLERVRATVSAFEAMGLPAAVMSSHCRALSVNSAMKAYSAAIRIGARDEVQLTNPSAHSLLIKALDGNGQHLGCSIPVPGTEATPPFVAHLLPLRGESLDVFIGARSLLYVTPLAQQSRPAVELIQALFDLTPAEARVAGLIAEGHPIESIVQMLEISSNTVRTHLKSIFTKTGVGRQAELVGLLSAAGLQIPNWKM